MSRRSPTTSNEVRRLASDWLGTGNGDWRWVAATMKWLNSRHQNLCVFAGCINSRLWLWLWHFHSSQRSGHSLRHTLCCARLGMNLLTFTFFLWTLPSQRALLCLKLQNCIVLDTIKIELTWKNLKNRNQSHTTVAIWQVLANDGHQQSTSVTLRTKFASCCRTKVVTISLLATMCPQGSRIYVTCRCIVVTGRWQRLPTKLWRPQKNKRRPRMAWKRQFERNDCCGLQRNLNGITCTANCFAVTNFQHAVNLPTDATDNFGRLRSLPDSSATSDGNQVCFLTTKISQDWHHFVIVVVDPDFASLTSYRQDTRRKGQYYQAHIPRSWPVSTTARFANSISNWHALVKKVNGKSFLTRQEQGILVTMK